MSIMINRRLLKAIIFAIISFALISNAQVKIKEKVEIHPGKRSPESLMDMPHFLTGNTVTLPFGGEVFVQSTVYAPLQVHQYLRMNGQIVLSDLQLTPFMYLGPYNGGAQLTFEYLVIDSDATPVATSIIPITAIQPLWEVNDCSSGQVFELGRIVDPGDGSEMFWNYGVQVGVARSVPVRPASKFVVWDAEALYTGDATLSAALQDVCGNQVESPGITVEAKIVGGREWGELFDPLTGKGRTPLDSVREEGGMYRINFHAWGTEPHQIEQVAIHLATSDGKYTSEGTITVYPNSDPLSVIPGRRQIPPGDTTKLDIQMLNSDWTPSTGELLSATYTIVQGGAWAYLYSPDSTVVGPSITGLFPSVRLFVPSSPDLPDSLDVVVMAHAEEPCLGCMDSKIVRDSNLTLPGVLPPKVWSVNPGQASLPTGAEAVSGMFANRSTRIRDSMIAVYRIRFGEEKLPKASTSRPTLLTVNSNRYLSGSPPPKLQYTLSHYGLVRVTVKKKNEILLGETRYYQAIKDPADNTKLSFKELKETNEAGNQDFSKVNFGVQVEQGGKLGVYWENKDQQGDDLRDDVIRLVGRYWEEGKTYSVKLSATAENRAGSEVIQVQKPVKLLTPNQSPDYAKIKDVTADPNAAVPNLDLDALIIKYAGENGIPPQFIKGQMLHETTFKPAWRYEPFSDMTYQNQKNKKDYFGKNMPFVVNETSMGTGDWPLGHSNVSPTPYINTPVKIAKFTTDHWDRYVRHETGENPDLIIGNKKLTGRWNELYEKVKVDKKLSDAKARELAHAKLKNELLDVKTALGQRYDIVAQTRKVTSYGFVQIVYITAASPPDNSFSIETDGRYKAIGTKYVDQYNNQLYPEKLNEQAFLMPIYCDLLLTKMKKLKFKSATRIPSFSWSEGFDETWRVTLQNYNYYETDYGKNVLVEAQRFLPSQ